MVVATTGFTPAERAFYADLRRRGVVVARTFPSGEQARAPGGADAEGGVPPLVAASHLTPLKARILLMLALTVTDDAREIQAIFDAH